MVATLPLGGAEDISRRPQCRLPRGQPIHGSGCFVRQPRAWLSRGNQRYYAGSRACRDPAAIIRSQCVNAADVGGLTLQKNEDPSRLPAALAPCGRPALQERYLVSLEDCIFWVVDCGFNVVSNFVYQLRTPKRVGLIIQDHAYMTKVEWHIVLIR